MKIDELMGVVSRLDASRAIGAGMPFMVMHPDTFAMLERSIPGGVQTNSVGRCAPGGTPIVVNEACPRYHTAWRVPGEPHIEYESSDLPWLKYFGYELESYETDEPAIFFLDPRIHDEYYTQAETLDRCKMRWDSGLFTGLPRFGGGILP